MVGPRRPTSRLFLRSYSTTRKAGLAVTASQRPSADTAIRVEDLRLDLNGRRKRRNLILLQTNANQLERAGRAAVANRSPGRQNLVVGQGGDPDRIIPTLSVTGNLSCPGSIFQSGLVLDDFPNFQTARLGPLPR